MKLTFLLSFLITSALAFSQPINDLCASATSLTVQTIGNCSGNETASTLIGATNSGDTSSCAESPNETDVWFSFTTSMDSNILLTLSNVNNVEEILAIELYTDCSTKIPNYCIGARNNEAISLPNLNSMTSYLIRVFTVPEFDIGESAFSICLSFAPPAPVNDSCKNVTSISVSDFGSCSSTNGTFFSANSEGVSSACTFGEEDDIWYSFNSGTDSSLLLSELEILGNSFESELYFEVYVSCGVIVNSSCGYLEENSTVNLVNLEPLTEYVLRIYRANFQDNFDFEFCLSKPPPLPANDACILPDSLVVQSYDNCIGDKGRTAGANKSGEVSGCFSSSNEVDVWYTFNTGSDSSLVIQFNKLANDFLPLGIELYETCQEKNNQNQCFFANSENNIFFINNLETATNYLIRVLSFQGNEIDSFTICVTKPPPAPVNDSCQNAFALAVNDVGNCSGNEFSATLIGATNSGVESSCQFEGESRDVWFKFNTGTENRLNLTIDETVNSIGYELYQNCSTKDNTLNCGRINGNGSIRISQLETSTEYWIRMFEIQNGSGFDFDICVSKVGAAPDNDSCQNATVLVPQTGENCTNLISGTTFGATNSGDESDCSFSNNEEFDVWYSFNSDTGINFSLFYDYLAPNFNGPVWYELYNACGVKDESEQCGAMYSNAEFISLNALDTQTTYLIRIMSLNDGRGEVNFDLCLRLNPNPPINDMCSGALLIEGDTSIESSNNDASSQNSPNCGPPQNNNLWYKIVGNDKHINLSTCDFSNFDTRIAVYAGNCNDLVCIAENDDACNSQSIVDFDALEGVTYFVSVGGYGQSKGDFTLTVTYSDGGAPDNDNCNNATFIQNTGDFGCTGLNNLGSTKNATSSAISDCDANVSEVDVWYEFYSNGTTADLKIFNLLYEGDSIGYELYSFCGMKATTVTNYCGKLANGERVSFAGMTNQSYYLIRIYSTGETNNRRTDFSFCLNTQELSETPANDLCSSAISISCGDTLTGTTEGASVLSSLADLNCSPLSKGVWYVVEGTGDSVNLSTCSFETNFDTRIEIYTGTCTELTCVDANDDLQSCEVFGNQSGIKFSTLLGQQYFVYVNGNESEGNFELVMSCKVTCFKATEFVVQSLSQTEVEVNWVSSNIGLSYFIEYGLDGFLPGTGTIVTGLSTNTNSITISGLTKQTKYSVILHENCAGSKGKTDTLESDVTTNNVSVKQYDVNPIEIYPNPSNDVLNVKGLMPMSVIRLNSLDGRLIQTFTTNLETEIVIDLKALKAGTYLLNYQTTTGVEVYKLIKD
ncbi:MAG: hypothetical protein ACJAZ3_000495 [Sphingobacteriales bacterium]|jgi:hypothetical protein